MPHVQGGDGGGGSTWLRCLLISVRSIFFLFNILVIDMVKINDDAMDVDIDYDDLVQVDIQGHRLRGEQLQVR